MDAGGHWRSALGLSYGFRPGRGGHDVLDALSFAITNRRVNWILDADIRSFFDTVDQDCLIRLVEQRIGDPRERRGPVSCQGADEVAFGEDPGQLLVSVAHHDGANSLEGQGSALDPPGRSAPWTRIT